MPPKQQLESRLIVLRDETLQELGIGYASGFLPAGDPAQMPKEPRQWCIGHSTLS
jgi:hypothetical protein